MPDRIYIGKNGITKVVELLAKLEFESNPKNAEYSAFLPNDMPYGHEIGRIGRPLVVSGGVFPDSGGINIIDKEKTKEFSRAIKFHESVLRDYYTDEKEKDNE